jgi:hypothetical protein
MNMPGRATMISQTWSQLTDHTKSSLSNSSPMTAITSSPVNYAKNNNEYQKRLSSSSLATEKKQEEEEEEEETNVNQNDTSIEWNIEPIKDQTQVKTTETQSSIDTMETKPTNLLQLDN